MLARRVISAVACSVLASGCVERSGGAPANESSEIVDNLLKAGFRADDITTVAGAVYVGRDAEVSLAASREMLQDDGRGAEQYRTHNLVMSVTKICIDGSAFTGAFSSALDLAIQNYDEQPLSFAMARTPSTGCGFTINTVVQPGAAGGVSGFPSGGLPFGSITIFDRLSTLSLDTIEHVITHEIGHTIGLRHSDFFNRGISCGTGGNEGDGGIGANFIPGTDMGATTGSSLMNSCFRTVESGEFTTSDVTALRTLYPDNLHPGIPGVPVWTACCCANPSVQCGWDTMSSTAVGAGLNWAASGMVARYEMQINDPSTSGSWVPFLNGATSGWTQVIFPDEYAGFRVRACNASGCSSFGPEYWVTVIMP